MTRSGFEKVAPVVDFPRAEARIRQFWRDADVFRKSLAKGRGGPRFVFYEGPPTANGMPHNGHGLTRVMKDVFPRYRSMRGYDAPRRAGWDTVSRSRSRSRRSSASRGATRSSPTGSSPSCAAAWRASFATPSSERNSRRSSPSGSTWATNTSPTTRATSRACGGRGGAPSSRPRRWARGSAAPGADAFRWFFYASNPPWNPTRHSRSGVRAQQRELPLKLRNVYAFFSIYASIDGLALTIGLSLVDGEAAAP